MFDLSNTLRNTGKSLSDAIRGLSMPKYDLQFPPKDPFDDEIRGMEEKKTPIQDVHKAIDMHPEITDKNKTKQKANDIYGLSDALRGMKRHEPTPEYKSAVEALMKSGKPISDALLNPGTSFATPALEKLGVPSGLALGAGLVGDILIGPGGKKKALEEGLGLGKKGLELAQEARKFQQEGKTLEEFVKGRTFPVYDLTNKPDMQPFVDAAKKSKSFAEFARGTYEIPVKNLGQNTSDFLISPGISRTPFEPVLASPPTQGGGTKFSVQDGVHRLRDAKIKGQETIKVKFTPHSFSGGGYWARLQDFYEAATGRKVNPTKSQLTDLWNQATKVEADTTTKDLLVVHNLSEQKLRFADRIGGLANPSTAVINPKLTSFEGYGDISLIGNKELIRGQKTKLADAYTARFPSVHTSMKYDDFKSLEKELDVQYKKIGDDARKLYHDDTDMMRNIENNSAVALKFLEEKGIQPASEGQHYYISQIRSGGLDGEYQSFLDGIYKKFNLNESMFAGYTPSGKRRYKPVTVGEASKIMGKQKEEGFNYGLGSYRSKIAPTKLTPEAIKKEKGRLVSKEQFEKIKEVHDKELWDIKDKLEPYAKITDSRNQFIESDYQLNAIGEVLSGEKDAWTYFNNKFPNAPENLKNSVIAFRDKLKKMPTEYFETKFNRPVGLNEFSIAVVPEGIPEKTLNILQKNGLQIVKYPKGEKAKVMQELLKRPEAFGKADVGTILKTAGAIAGGVGVATAMHKKKKQ